MADTFSNRKGAFSSSPLFWVSLALITGIAYLAHRSEKLIRDDEPKVD
jgi:hypothetical protein